MVPHQCQRCLNRGYALSRTEHARGIDGRFHCVGQRFWSSLGIAFRWEQRLGPWSNCNTPFRRDPFYGGLHIWLMPMGILFFLILAEWGWTTIFKVENGYLLLVSTRTTIRSGRARAI